MGQPQSFDEQFKDEMGEFRLPALRFFFAAQILPGYLNSEERAKNIWHLADELAREYINEENANKGAP